MNEYVQNKVNAPGLALAVFGGVCILLNLMGAIWQVINAVRSIMVLVPDAPMEAWMAFATSQGVGATSMLIAFVCSFVVTIAGMRLRQARSAGLVYAGAIIAMLPCCMSYCCCLGLPLGIWAIVAMQDDEVKAAFAEA